jgi:ATP-dependent RNA helicase UAP56/SUB2
MGKTAVFVLTTLNRLADITEGKDEISCLVLAHTRELAFQIAKEFDRFSVNLGYKTAVIIGGENMSEQSDKLKEKPQIVVGTPGRLLSFIKKGILDTKNVKIFIIDECDKMLKELGKL